MRLLYLVIMLLLSTFSNSQKLNTPYLGISSDSVGNGFLKFVNDSTLELNSVPRHMSQTVKLTLKYQKDGNVLTVFARNMEGGDTAKLKYFGFQNPSTKLVWIDGNIVNESTSVVYFKPKKRDSNLKVAYVIDGDTYIADMGRTNAYGLRSKKPKPNRKLQKRLEDIRDKDFKVEAFKGLEAYKRFRINDIYAVIVITTKK